MSLLPFQRDGISNFSFGAPDHAQDYTQDYAQGGGTEAAIMSWASAHGKTLISEIADYNAAIDDYQSLSGQAAPKLMGALEGAEAQLQAVADDAAARLPYAFDTLRQTQKSLKTFQLAHHVTRPPRRVDGLMNVSILTVMAIAEGITTSVFFLSGGFVAGIAEALGLGLSISAANILLSALIGGNVFGRYWNAGLGARASHGTGSRTTRIVSRIGAVLTACAILALLVTSGIVRAGGEPEHLSFTFAALSAAASDFHSLMLWLVGGSFSILAWRKGLSLFSDALPGYSDVASAVHDAQDDIEALREIALDEIEQAFEDGRDAIEAIADEAQDALDERGDDYGHLLETRNALIGDIGRFVLACAARIAEENHLSDLFGGRRGVEASLPNRLGASLKAMMKAVPEQGHDAGAKDGADAISAAAASLDLLSAARSKATETVLAASAPAPDPFSDDAFDDDVPF